MPPRLKYVKRTAHPVAAVRFAFDGDGFSYRKWGGLQHCKSGDWIVDNQGDVYTVDATTFARTYRQIGPGAYEKVAPVWAEVATAAGAIATKEGATAYRPGDYLVFNEENGGDGYAVAADVFREMYEPAG